MPPLAYRLTLFLVLSCAFTWFGHLGNWLWPSPYWPVPMNPLGPIFAAPLSIWLTEGGAAVRTWLRRIARVRAPYWVWMMAMLIPATAIVVSLAVAVLGGAATQPLVALDPLEYLILVPITLLMGPGTEEPAFRGYGQVALEGARSPLAASLLVGVGVVIWHTPLLLGGYIAWPFGITIVLVSVVYAWLLRMGGSVWPLVLLHFTVNYLGGEVLGGMLADAQGQMLYALVFCVVFVAVVGLIVWRYGPGLDVRRRTRPAAQPA
jgi:membrane protease YdiL (CAAX protease family)